MVLNICLMVQVARAAQNHARTEAFVPPSEKRVMNVTAPGPATPGPTAPRVSLNASQGQTSFAELVFPGLSHIHVLVCVFPAEFLTWIKVSLKPSPNTVHYLLTHFKGFWNIINNVSFLRDAIMRYVLTCKSPTSRRILWRVSKTRPY